MNNLEFPISKSSQLDIKFLRYQSQEQFERLQEIRNIVDLTQQALTYEKYCYLAEYSPDSDIYAKVTLIFDESHRGLITGNFHFTEIRKGTCGETVKCIKQEKWDSILVKYQFDKRDYVNHPNLRYSEIHQGPDSLERCYVDVWIPIRFICS